MQVQSSQRLKRIPKVLLMGKGGVGKSSMKAIIFANSSPKNTFNIEWTYGVVESELNIMGKMMISLFDCGGQNQFIEEYINSKSEAIFSNVDLLIFVVEAKLLSQEEIKNTDDMKYLEKCIKNLQDYSPGSKRIFVLINKIDLLRWQKRKETIELFQQTVLELCTKYSIQCECLATSMWNVSLYQAWTRIITSLMVNVDQLTIILKSLAEATNAEEIVLLDKTSFLPLCHYCMNNDSDIFESKLEAIASILKKFRLSLVSERNRNSSSNIEDYYQNTKTHRIFIVSFSQSTFLMVVIKTIGNEKCTEKGLIEVNIEISKKLFEEALI